MSETLSSAVRKASLRRQDCGACDLQALHVELKMPTAVDIRSDR